MPISAKRRLSHWVLVSRFWPLVSSLPIEMISARMEDPGVRIRFRPTPDCSCVGGQPQLETGADVAGAGLDVQSAPNESRPADGKGKAKPDATRRDIGLPATAECAEDQPPFPRRHSRTAILDLEQHRPPVAPGPQPDAV